MNATPQRLPAVSLPGLTLDTLGLYLASLGLLRVLSREWKSVRGCWRDGCFTIVRGPVSPDKLEKFVYKIGLDKKWSDYGKPWDTFQKKDTQLTQTKKPATHMALWRAHDATENEAMLQQSHIAIGQKLNFNPLFGSGGNAGQRVFAKGWEKARGKIISPSKKTAAEDIKRDLHAFLNGKPCRCLSDFSAGSWFSAANKVYNSGFKPYRKGQVTPWAMLLACEALPLLAGSRSRQLGAHRRAFGAFPFVTRAAAPLTEQAAGKALGEFWAPVWARPMSLAEADALFQSGRAELDGRAALTSAAFAGAVIHRGINAGLSEFRNFALIRTTSDNTFESRLSSVVRVPQSDPVLSTAIRRSIATRDSLPRDEKQGKRWRFRGLQGRIDRALIALAESVGENQEALRIERSWQLIDEVFASLAKVDRNKAFREKEVRFELLPLDWLTWLLERTHVQHVEIRLALALASLNPEVRPNAPLKERGRGPQRFLAYRLGAVGKGRYWGIPKDIPLRRVWSPQTLTGNLIALGKRRLFESAPNQPPPFRSAVSADPADALQFLSQGTDDEALGVWIDRFSLFDWSDKKESKDRLRDWVGKRELPEPNGAGALLYGFFRPLFDQSSLTRLQTDSRTSDGQQSAPSTSAGRLAPIVSALDGGDVAGACEIASAAYRAERIVLADFHLDSFSHERPDRLLASLFFPVSARGLRKLFARWRSPSTYEKEQTL